MRPQESQDGNADSKHTIRVSWTLGDWGAPVSGVRLGDFIQASPTLEDPVNGDPIDYVVPSVTTYNVAVNYRFDGWMDTTM